MSPREVPLDRAWRAWRIEERGVRCGEQGRERRLQRATEPGANQFRAKLGTTYATWPRVPASSLIVSKEMPFLSAMWMNGLVGEGIT